MCQGSHRSKFTKWSILPEGILDGTSVWMDDVLLLEPYIFFWTGSADGPLEIFHVSGKKVWSLAGGPLAARIALVLSEECMSDYDDLDRVVPCVDVEMAFISASLSSVPTLPCLSYGNVLTPPRLASLYGMVTDGIESRVREMGLPSRLSRKKVLDLLYGENMAIPASGCEGDGWQLFVHVFGECTSRLVHTLAGLYRLLVSLYPIDMPEIRPLEKSDLPPFQEIGQREKRILLCPQLSPWAKCLLLRFHDPGASMESFSEEECGGGDDEFTPESPLLWGEDEEGAEEAAFSEEGEDASFSA